MPNKWFHKEYFGVYEDGTPILDDDFQKFINRKFAEDIENNFVEIANERD